MREVLPSQHGRPINHGSNHQFCEGVRESSLIGVQGRIAEKEKTNQSKTDKILESPVGDGSEAVLTAGVKIRLEMAYTGDVVYNVTFIEKRAGKGPTIDSRYR